MFLGRWEMTPNGPTSPNNSTHSSERQRYSRNSRVLATWGRNLINVHRIVEWRGPSRRPDASRASLQEGMPEPSLVPVRMRMPRSAEMLDPPSYNASQNFDPLSGSEQEVLEPMLLDPDGSRSSTPDSVASNSSMVAQTSPVVYPPLRRHPRDHAHANPRSRRRRRRRCRDPSPPNPPPPYVEPTPQESELLLYSQQLDRVSQMQAQLESIRSTLETFEEVECNVRDDEMTPRIRGLATVLSFLDHQLAGLWGAARDRERRLRREVDGANEDRMEG